MKPRVAFIDVLRMSSSFCTERAGRRKMARPTHAVVEHHVQLRPCDGAQVRVVRRSILNQPCLFIGGYANHGRDYVAAHIATFSGELATGPAPRRNPVPALF